MNYHPKRKNIPHPAVIAGVSLLAVIVILAVVFSGRTKHRKETVGIEPVTGIVYDDAAVEGGWENLSQEEIEAALNEKVAQGMINISMNTAPVFADGRAEGNVMIVNEVIYTSNAIPVGSKIEHAALDVDLEAGTYECTALFHNLDPETGAILGTAGAIINITIQN